MARITVGSLPVSEGVVTMPSKRALVFTVVSSISLWALLCILPDQSALAATSKIMVRWESEQIADSSPSANRNEVRAFTGNAQRHGDPDQSTETGDQEPQPNPPLPESGLGGGRSLLDTLLRTLIQVFGAVRGPLQR
jgi:hypothetical protein